MLPSLAAALLLLASATSAQNQQCYRRTNNHIREVNTGWFVCNGTSTSSGGADLCCLNGSQCGEDSICHSKTANNNDNWYVGACTDEEYNDPICRRDCTGEKGTWITYNNGKSMWQCCGAKGCNEGSPTSESFKAVSPAQWSPISGQKSSSGGSSSGSSGSKGGSSSNSNNMNNMDDGSLSTAEMAGIGIGGAVALIALAIGGFCFFRSRSRKSRTRNAGIKGRYEELGTMAQRGRAPSPQPYAGRGRSSEPYNRATSPVPPLRSMSRQRAVSPLGDERSRLPTVVLPDDDAGPSSFSNMSRKEDDGA